MLSSGKLHFSLLKSLCNSQYKYLIFSTFYGLYITHRDQRPPGLGVIILHLFWEKWLKTRFKDWDYSFSEWK